MILGVEYGAPATTVAALLDGVLTSGAAGPARAVCVAVDLDTVRLAPVAALRIAGPCPPSLEPLVGWPDGSGVAAIVSGGHSLTGRGTAPLDADAVARFAASCGLSDFAITAAGSPVTADHELAAAEIIAAEVPGARITLSYEFGRPGLRERENSAIMNAALSPEADRIADALAADAPLYFARTGHGLVSAHYFRRYPLVCYLGAFTSALRGGAALACRTDTAVQVRSPGRPPRTGLVAGGAPRTASNSRGMNVAVPVEVEADEGVVVGALAAQAGDGWMVPERAELAIAYGAALATPAAEVERIVQAKGRAELDRALGDAHDEALARVVSAGAAPGSARITQTTVNPLSYLPDGLYRVGVSAEGDTP